MVALQSDHTRWWRCSLATHAGGVGDEKKQQQQQQQHTACHKLSVQYHHAADARLTSCQQVECLHNNTSD